VTGTNVGTAYLEVIPSAKGFAGKLQSQVGGDMAKGGRAAGESYSKGFSGGLKKLVGVAAGVVAVDRIAGFVNESVAAASDLNETVNKSSVIFGKNAGAIEKWAATSDTALGLSKQAAIDAAASYGDMFLQLGIGEQRATGMSKGVVKLAADLGSFNNLDTSDVLERIAGGFRGEYDALQKVIPNISAARVQQKALAQTHKKSVTDLTAAEKATATLAIIQHDGARAAGDFARTSSGLANSQKIQAAEAENLKAKIGTGLLPIQLAYTRFMADKAIPAISEFVTGMQDGTGAGGEFADMLSDARDIGKGVLSFFNSIPGPVKKYGVELAIAAVALSKINSGLTAGRTNISNWLTSLGPADKKLTATAKASYALGAGIRNLAGAGGMVALADGATKSSSALSALELVGGGAAAGFATGGPVGAAVGSLAGGFFALAKEVRAGGKAAKDTLPTWMDYADTLDGVGAATGRATREMVLERFEKTGLLTKTRDLNIADRDAIQASLGNEAARKRVSAALRDATKEGKGYEALKVAEKLGAETSAIASSRVEQLKKNLALAATKEEAQKIQAKLDRLARTNANPQVTIGGASKAISQLTAIQTLIFDITHSKSKGDIGAPASSFSGLLDPNARAAGGPVRAGHPYIVGERRPELFVPSVSGRIEPRVPSGGVDSEQAYFRAFVRALTVSRAAVVPRNQLAAADFAGIA
jgi:hypothetical protein